MNRIIVIGIVFLISHPLSAWATQSHGGPEGLHVHQMAHLFFMFSMGLLIYWLRKRRLVTVVGWRYIQYAALFFIAWNLDAAFSHWIEEQSALITIHNTGPMLIHIQTAPGYAWLTPVYYITKLDHLLCVPALVLWYLGFRRLLKSPTADAGIRESTP